MCCVCLHTKRAHGDTHSFTLISIRSIAISSRSTIKSALWMNMNTPKCCGSISIFPTITWAFNVSLKRQHTCTLPPPSIEDYKDQNSMIICAQFGSFKFLSSASHSIHLVTKLLLLFAFLLPFCCCLKNYNAVVWALFFANYKRKRSSFIHLGAHHHRIHSEHR